MKVEGSGKSGPMASLIKLRRRLTVGGTTETIDGVAKLKLPEPEVEVSKQISNRQDFKSVSISKA